MTTLLKKGEKTNKDDSSYFLESSNLGQESFRILRAMSSRIFHRDHLERCSTQLDETRSTEHIASSDKVLFPHEQSHMNKMQLIIFSRFSSNCHDQNREEKTASNHFSVHGAELSVVQTNL